MVVKAKKCKATTQWRSRIVNRTPASRLVKKMAGASLLTIGLYFLIPTPDGAFVHPLFGAFLANIFHMSFTQGLITSVSIFTTIGIILCIIGGGKQTCHILKSLINGRQKIEEKAT